MFHTITVACLLLGALLAGCRDSGDEKPAQVTVRDHTWYVDLAMTADQRYQGLSGRHEIPANVGMLFIYPRPQVMEFCMRGCVVPLDIAYLDANRRVIKMHTMAVEPDRAGQISYSSDRPAQYALEVAGGALGGAGVQVGDTVVFSANIPPAAKADPGL